MNTLPLFRAPFGRRVIAVAMTVMLAAGCDRRPPVPSGDSTATADSSSASVGEAVGASGSGWDDRLGSFLVLPTVDNGLTAGSLLRPEATELTAGDTAGIGMAAADGRIDLFARSGPVGSARLTVEPATRVDAGCTAWPVARLAVDAGGTAAPWTAAFPAGRVESIPLDSIEGLTPRDSTRLATALTRLASALPDDTSRTFHGLPFVVLRAWRSRGLDTAFVVTTLARRVNQEDAPKEERLVLVVDALGDDPTRWTVAWHERAAGNEDELVVAEPLLAFRLIGAREPRLLFGRDDGVALSAAMLARESGGWRVRWESAMVGCN